MILLLKNGKNFLKILINDSIFGGRVVKNNVVNVIGLGYIGLPTALMLAANGVKVVGTDYNRRLVETLKNGKTTFKEKGLEELFNAAIKNDIKFATEYQITNTYIVSVPAPYDRLSKKVDASYVVNAVNKVLDVCQNDTVIVIESTISPGTIDKYIRPIVKDKEVITGKKINLVHAPERIIPGNMVYELLHNNRTIGADTDSIGEEIKKLYTTFCQGNIIVTNIRTAEMTKVIENTFRAVNIGFANELAKLCRYMNMDVYEIIKICNMHPRVNILQPGPGVGGHCISVDPWFLVGDYPALTKIIDAAMKINDSMPDFVLNRIYEIMRKTGISDISRVGLYGLTYKEDVDDTRESPTLQLLKSQKRHLGNVLKVYDPFIKEDIVEQQYHNFDEFINDIDFIVILVGHDELKIHLDKLKGKIILDTKSICKNIENIYYL